MHDAEPEGRTHSPERSREEPCRAGPLPMPEAGERVQSRAGRWLLIAVGLLLVAVGVVGAFVPLLPTTCFLLGAAVCFGRSSPRLYRWLHENRWFGRYLTEYRAHGRIPETVRWWTVTVLWGTLAITGIWAVSGVGVRLLLAAVGAGVTAHLFSLDSTAGRAPRTGEHGGGR